jgi:hypothetical protein
LLFIEGHQAFPRRQPELVFMQFNGRDPRRSNSIIGHPGRTAIVKLLRTMLLQNNNRYDI